MNTLTIYLDEPTNAHLQSYCQFTGITYNEAIKIAIATLVTPNTSPIKLAESLNLIGCFDSEIGDLGYNHSQHLREKLQKSHEQSTN